MDRPLTRADDVSCTGCAERSAPLTILRSTRQSRQQMRSGSRLSSSSACSRVILMANLRHYTFMIEGLAETAQKLAQRKCGFVLRICDGANSADEFARFCTEVKPSIVVCDEDPARRDATWKQEALLHPSAPLWSVDADVIVPSILLEKEQFAARTIRPRIQRRLAEFLKPPGNQSVRVPWNPDRKIKSVSVSPELIDRLHIDRSVSCAAMFRGGTDAALGALRGFIRDHLSDYASDRNKPEIDGTSRLSPYLHFGQIGPHTVALAIRGAAAPARDRDAFLEELIVRRELAVNFVRYNPRYQKARERRAMGASHDTGARSRRARVPLHGKAACERRDSRCSLERCTAADGQLGMDARLHADVLGQENS